MVNISNLVELYSIDRSLWREDIPYGVLVDGEAWVDPFDCFEGFLRMSIKVGPGSGLVYWYHDHIYIEFQDYARKLVRFDSPCGRITLPWGYFTVVSPWFLHRLLALKVRND